MATRSLPESRLAAFHEGHGLDPETLATPKAGTWMGGWAFNRVGSSSGTESSPSAHKVHSLTAEERAQVESS